MRLLLLSCLFNLATAHAADERIVGLPCEGCEAVFQGKPAAIPAEARIGTLAEPGEKMVLDGIVKRDGKPVARIIVYAYQTNAGGVYPPEDQFPGQAAYRHGKLRAWAMTDTQGRYRFTGIRPGGYPGTDIPQHVHLHVIEPGRCTYYIDDVLFEDDPRLTARQRASHARGRGGNGIVMPRREGAGKETTWLATRDIELGRNIAGYAGCQ